jgi:polyphosphate glucokinase
MEQLTLSVDCGGLGIKASVLDSAGTMRIPAIRVPTPYPLSPRRLVETIADLGKSLPKADRATVGMPGMIRHGVVVATPHYINVAGPLTRLDPALKVAWDGFDMRQALTDALKIPTLVLNDAEVHGAGVVAGSGF